MLLIITGCGVKYELTIEDDTLTENVNFDLIPKPDSEYFDEEYYQSKDFYNDILNSDISVFDEGLSERSGYYTKEITPNGSSNNVNLSYVYKNGEFQYSKIINSCFEYRDIQIKDKKVYIHLSGQFYCYDGSPIEIVINSKNKVVKTNGKKDGDSYIWTIDENNSQAIDIMIKTSDKKAGTTIRDYIYTIIAIVAGAIILLGAVYYVGTLMGRNGVNDI